ncbi:hypothetical protein [Streptomyces sp. SID9124]|uniref:hypothetical protein n=1 Tax=Streptomyces sp. SID9124 TaxID=2706108 RepID=UPI0013DF692C|nr:hypothetical protein [Streptomyces sp. SID9124]NED10836.1 hypothetical protein [Streptomyces sp. SID9124]
MEQGSEKFGADTEAARARYRSDMRASRKALRDAVRADLPAAHFGLGIVVVASVVTGLFEGAVVGSLVAGFFGAAFLAFLAVMLLRGIRGVDAGRRAYLSTFGWANWF